MSLIPFPVTDLGPEVELMHLLRVRRHYCHVWNRRHWTDSRVRLNVILFTIFCRLLVKLPLLLSHSVHCVMEQLDSFRSF